MANNFLNLIIPDIFKLVFIDREDDNHKLTTAFSYKGKSFYYIKMHVNEYTTQELMSILLLYDLGMNYKDHSNNSSGKYLHKDRVHKAYKYLSQTINHSGSINNSYEYNFNEFDTSYLIDKKEIKYPILHSIESQTNTIDNKIIQPITMSDLLKNTEKKTEYISDLEPIQSITMNDLLKKNTNTEKKTEYISDPNLMVDKFGKYYKNILEINKDYTIPQDQKYDKLGNLFGEYFKEFSNKSEKFQEKYNKIGPIFGEYFKNIADISNDYTISQDQKYVKLEQIINKYVKNLVDIKKTTEASENTSNNENDEYEYEYEDETIVSI